MRSKEMEKKNKNLKINKINNGNKKTSNINGKQNKSKKT